MPGQIRGVSSALVAHIDNTFVTVKDLESGGNAPDITVIDRDPGNGMDLGTTVVLSGPGSTMLISHSLEVRFYLEHLNGPFGTAQVGLTQYVSTTTAPGIITVQTGPISGPGLALFPNGLYRLSVVTNTNPLDPIQATAFAQGPVIEIRPNI